MVEIIFDEPKIKNMPVGAAYHAARNVETLAIKGLHGMQSLPAKK